MKAACTVRRGAKGVKAPDLSRFLLKDELTAAYSMEIWKRFRKWGGIPTGITQNVKDFLASKEIENIFDNSDFVYMLNQGADDRDILAQKLNISQHQIKYVTNVGQGEGLIFFGDIVQPFVDRLPKDTVMYSLLTTKPAETKPAETKIYHTVKAGDDLTHLAIRYGTTIMAILQMNPAIKNPNKIYIGQKIRVK